MVSSASIFVHSLIPVSSWIRLCVCSLILTLSVMLKGGVLMGQVRSGLPDACPTRFLLRDRTLWGTWSNLEFGALIWWDRIVQDRSMVI